MQEQRQPFDERTPHEIGVATLHHAAEYAERVSVAVGEAAALFRAAKTELGNQYLAETLDAINVLLVTIDAAYDAMHAKQDERISTASESQGWIEALCSAHAAEDWIRVADILEFDAGQSLVSWRDRIRAGHGATR